ncbi:MAG: alpha/beta hydrolase [Bryobacteraceae bacterium]
MTRVLVSLLALLTVVATAAEPANQTRCTSGTLAALPYAEGGTHGSACAGRFSELREIPFTFAVLSLFASRSHYPFEKAPLAHGQLEVAQVSETGRLTVERVRFWSDEMNEPRFFLALVPKPPTRSTDVFILNHGWFDRPEDLLAYLKVDEVYDAMLARGELRPAVVVIPDVRFKKFYRLNSAHTPFPNYLTLEAEEIAGIVSQRYKIPFERARWSIGGFSFGGYASLDIGRRYPGRFASVSVISGLVDPQWSFWPARPSASGIEDFRGRNRDTVVVPGPIPRLFLACGTNDRLYRTMQRLHHTLDAIGIPYTWSSAPGGHTWKYWSSVIPPMLRFSLGTDQTVATR